MSQARVTDFFSQRKKSGVGEATLGKGHKLTQGTISVENGSSRVSAFPPSIKPKTRSSRSKNTNAITKCTRSNRADNSVHEEFLRVIDEATGVDPAETSGFLRPVSVDTSKNCPPSPQTPKRTATEAEFDIGAAVFSTTADHSTAKKRQRLESNKGPDTRKDSSEKTGRRTARKKLILPQGDEQPPACDVPETPVVDHAVAEKDIKHQVVTSSPPANHKATKQTGKQGSKVLSKEDVAALKSRLQKIKKQAEKLSNSSSPSPPGPAESSPTAKAFSPAPKPDTAPTKSPTRPAVDGVALKSTLARAKELAARAQKRKEEKQAEASRETQTQPETQDGDSLPAYQRYHTLAQPVLPGLSLPYQYKLLAEMFRSMDTIVGMLYNRSETVTFAKVKQGVQDMMHRRFEESHLGQIKMVFPAAYTFRQEKNIPTFSSSIKKGSYQLTVEPVIHTDQKEARPVLSASCILERRHIFHQNLVSIVKQHHKVFLSSLDPPMSVPDDQLTRWHPRFNVDTVPAVETSPLPQPPNTEKLTTAQEVLDKARSLMTPKMEKALANMALKTAETAVTTEKEKEVVPPPPSGTPPATTTSSTPASSTPATPAKTPSALKGVSQSLLERIRAKEAQKLQAAMTRDQAQEERLLMMSRLGELARILRNVFVAEKKPALIMELACNRMVASYRSALSTGEMEKHLRLLAELAPDWLTVHSIRKDFYLKLNRTMELNVVLDKLTAKLKEEERR